MAAIPGRDRTSCPLGKRDLMFFPRLGAPGRAWGELVLVRVLTPHSFCPFFPKQVGFKVESAALVLPEPNRISIHFLLVSPGCVRQSLVAVYQKIPQCPGHTGRGPIWEPPSRVEVGVSVRPLTWQTFVCGHRVPRRMMSLSARGKGDSEER